MRNMLLGLAALMISTVACASDPWLDDMESRARAGDLAAANTVEAVQRGLMTTCTGGAVALAKARFYSGSDWNFNCMELSGSLTFQGYPDLYWPGTGTRLQDVAPRSFVSRAPSGVHGGSYWIFTDDISFQMHQAPGGGQQPPITGGNCNGATTYGQIPYGFHSQADPFWALVSLYWIADQIC